MKRNPFFALPVAAAIISFAASICAADVFRPGEVRREWWFGKTRGQVNTNTAGAPSGVQYDLTIFESPADIGDNYSQRFSGVFIPPATGNYVFFIAADDSGDLFLGSDASAATKRLIVQETSWSSSRQWTGASAGGSDLAQKRSDQFSPDGGATRPFASGIPLVAGNRYYLEGVQQEDTGGANFSATYKLVSEPDPVNGDEPLLAGPVIGSIIEEPTVFRITRQPQSTNAVSGAPLVLSIAVETDANVQPLYQWRRNGVNIGQPSAHPTLSILAGPGDSGATYDAVVKLPFLTNQLTSAVATITVQSGVIVPNLLREEIFPGATREDVQGGNVPLPETINTISRLDTAVNIGDQYTRRVTGYFTPPATDRYVFFLNADDDADLYLSTDESAQSKRLIARETVWSSVGQWHTSAGGSDLAQKRSDTFSPDGGATVPFATGISLEAGRRYYLEAIQREIVGGDHLQVTFKGSAEEEPFPGDPSRLTGDLISFTTRSPSIFQVTVTNVTANEGQTATFTADVTTDAELRPSFQWRKDGTPIANATGQSYSLLAFPSETNSVFDVVATLAGGSVTSGPARLTVIAGSVFAAGSLKLEYFPGATLDAVDSGSVSTPANVSYITQFQLLDRAETYSQRVSGFFIAPVSGNYVFFLAADNAAKLYLSSDATIVNKRLIAQETVYSSPRQYLRSIGGSNVGQKRSDLWSPDAGATVPYANGIPLVAGQRYYIEAVHREDTGGDHLSITFRLTSEPDPIDGSNTRMTTDLIGTFADKADSLTITRQPTNPAPAMGLLATLNIGISTDSVVPPISQWRRDGVSISGAISTNYSFMTSASDHNAVFDAVVSVPGITLTSAPVTLALRESQIIKGSVQRDLFPTAPRAAVESGNVPAPTRSIFLTEFQSPVQADGDNFSQRVHGLFFPPATGNYVLLLNADDDADLFLSTDQWPAKKRLVAQETVWSSVRFWNTSDGGSELLQKHSDTFSPDGGATTPFANGIPLEAGEPYYIEAVAREGAGGDHVEATFRLVGEPDPENGTPTLLTGDLIGRYAPAIVSPRLSISGNPQAITITWTGGGVLESADQVQGTYVSTGDSDGSYTTTAAGRAKFFRVRR